MTRDKVYMLKRAKGVKNEKGCKCKNHTMIFKKRHTSDTKYSISLYEAQNRHNFKKTQRVERSLFNQWCRTVDNHTQENNCTPTSDQRRKPTKDAKSGSKT